MTSREELLDFLVRGRAAIGHMDIHLADRLNPILDKEVYFNPEIWKWTETGIFGSSYEATIGYHLLCVYPCFTRWRWTIFYRDNLKCPQSNWMLGDTCYTLEAAQQAAIAAVRD